MGIKYLKIAAVAIATLTMLSACGNNPEPLQPQESSAESTTSQAVETSETSSESTSNAETSSQSADAPFSVNMLQAVDIFSSEFPNAQIDKLDFDANDGEFEYQVSAFEGNTEYEVEINAETGELREVDVDDGDNDEDPIDFSTIITGEEAVEIARAEFREDSEIEQWELDIDNGRPEYYVESFQDEEIVIHAETGEIIELDLDN